MDTLLDVIEIFIPGDWGNEEYTQDAPNEVICIRGADIENVKSGIFQNIPRRYVSNSSINKKTLVKGDIIIEKSGGSPTQSTGRVCYISDEFIKSKRNIVCSNFCAAFRLKSNWYYKYIYYYLQNIYNQGNFFNYEGKTSGIRNLLLETAFQAISLPNILTDVQKITVKILDKIDQKINLNTRMNAELEAMAKQLYDYWFVQFDFPNENGTPYKSSGGKMVYNEKLKREIPECWDDKQICDIAHIIAGRDCPKNFSLTKSSKYSIPIYSNGIDNNGLYGYTDKSTSPARSVTVSARGTIGYPILRLEPFVPIIRLIVATPYDEGTDIYLYEYLRVIDIKNTGSVQPQLPVPEFSIITIPYPKNIEIIKAFSELTRKWYITIEQNRKYNEYLTHLRDSLLPMLMNGQVTVENLPIFWRI